MIDPKAKAHWEDLKKKCSRLDGFMYPVKSLTLEELVSVLRKKLGEEFISYTFDFAEGSQESIAVDDDETPVAKWIAEMDYPEAKPGLKKRYKELVFY